MGVINTFTQGPNSSNENPSGNKGGKNGNQKSKHSQRSTRNDRNTGSGSQPLSQQSVNAQEKSVPVITSKPAPGSWAEKLLSGNMEAPMTDPMQQKKKTAVPTVDGNTDMSANTSSKKSTSEKSNGAKSRNGGDKRGRDGSKGNGNKKSSTASFEPSKNEEAKQDDVEISTAPANWEASLL